MKVKTLVKYLLENNQDAEVVLPDEDGYKQFTGINTDDNGDVELYISSDDKNH